MFSNVGYIDAINSQSEIHSGVKEELFTTDGSTENGPQTLVQLLVRIDLR
jgi:hypothetical protein